MCIVTSLHQFTVNSKRNLLWLTALNHSPVMTLLLHPLLHLPLHDQPESHQDSSAPLRSAPLYALCQLGLGDKVENNRSVGKKEKKTNKRIILKWIQRKHKNKTVNILFQLCPGTMVTRSMKSLKIKQVWTKTSCRLQSSKGTVTRPQIPGQIATYLRLVDVFESLLNWSKYVLNYKSIW